MGYHFRYGHEMSTRMLFAAASQGGAGNAYRYWRLYVTAVIQTNGSGLVGIYEMELRATLGGVDLTTSSTPIAASSSYDEGEGGYYGPQGAIDNIASSYPAWIGAGYLPTTPQWIRVDLGSAKSVAQLALYSMGNSGTPTAFKVQGSNNDSTWADVASFSGLDNWSAWKTFNL